MKFSNKIIFNAAAAVSFFLAFVNISFASDINVNVSASSVSASYVGSATTGSLTLKVAMPDGTVAKANGSISDLLTVEISLGDGNYRYSVIAVDKSADSEDDYESSKEQGSFAVENGGVITESEGLLGYSEYHNEQTSSLVENVLASIVDFMIPVASAQVVSADAAPEVDFDDTNDGNGGVDWRFWGDVNDATSTSRFGLWDLEHDSYVLSQEIIGINSTGSSSRSMMIEANGDMSFADDTVFIDKGSDNIGIDELVPEESLHITDSDPTIVLEDTAGTTWGINNDAGSSIFDIANRTAGTSIFKIGSGAPSNSLVVESDGDVGIGTQNPEGNLHIFGGANSDTFNAVGPSGSTDALNFGYSGASFGTASGFFNVRPTPAAVAPNPAIYFMTSNVERLMIDRDGDIGVDLDNSFGNTFDPAHPIQAQNSGAYLSTAGVWTNASSRTLKENIGELTVDAALSALESLQPVTYNYKSVPSDPQVGFIAEDVPDLVATPDRKTLAHGEIVSVLTRVVQQLQDRVDQQALQIEALLDYQKPAVAGR